MHYRECGICGREMTLFISQDDKAILMCSCCGSIYLPVETRDKRIVGYDYSCDGTFIPNGDIPSYKQASYLKILCNQLNLEEVDVYSMTKEEVTNLISELKQRKDVMLANKK
jgi:hypothetical protein